VKAIRVHQFGAPEVMRLEQIDDPKVGPGQILVRVKAAGVNPVDTYIRSGQYSRRANLPFTPGFDAAGVVESAGEGVTGVAAGDRVYTAGTLSGAYAELALCEASQVHRLPDQASFQQGAALGVPYAIAYRALFQRAHAKPGETVLVHGATGGAGLAAVQLARARGLVVLATGGAPESRDLVARQGADHVFDHKDPAHYNRILDVTASRGVDVILEMLANVNLGNDLTVLAEKGRVVVIGSRGTVEIDPRETISREATVLGALVFSASAAEYREIHAALRSGLAQGSLKPIIGREMPLADAPQAHREVIESRAYGKIVLIP
jgi:NADPH2:quinone reductase